MKVALICHEFSPYQGSECREGWNIALALNQNCNLTIYAASGNHYQWYNYKNHYDHYVNKNGNPFNYPVRFIDQSLFSKTLSIINRLFRSFSAIGLPPIYFLGYRLWLKNVESEIKEQDYEIVHLLTSITFREPGIFYHNNFVWGPTGGLSKLPRSFVADLPFKNRVIEKIRDFITHRSLKNKKRIYEALRNARKIYAFSVYDQKQFEIINKNSVTLLPDGMCDNDISNQHIEPYNGKLKLVWCGQLVQRKCIDILLNSLTLISSSEKNKLSVTLVGTGPQLNYCKAFIKSKLSDIDFTITGNVSHEQVSHILRRNHFLIHTSYREASTNIIPEALSMSTAVICHKISGMDLLIDENSGFKIELVNKKYSANEISKVIRRILENPEKIIDYQKKAFYQSRKFTFNRAAQTFIEDYKEILEKTKFQ